MFGKICLTIYENFLMPAMTENQAIIIMDSTILCSVVLPALFIGSHNQHDLSKQTLLNV